MPQLDPQFLALGAILVLVLTLTPASARRGTLLAANVVFLGWWDARAVALGLGLCAGTVALARSARLSRHLSRAAVTGLGLGMLVLVFVSLRTLREHDGWETWLVPIGLGFLVLRLWQYLAERDQHPPHQLIDVCNWALFFPAVMVGPVQRFDHFLRGERRQRWDPGRLAEGLERVLLGYVKVVLIGGVLVGRELQELLLRLPGSLEATAGPRDALLTMLSQYYAFAGCSDIAVGLAWMVGQSLPENFENPLLSRNIGEFWRRWHISVSEWCRVQVYLPILVSTRSVFAATVGSMMLLGFWHHVHVSYFVWGLYQAAGILVWRAWRHLVGRLGWAPREGWMQKVGDAAAMCVTFVYVAGGFWLVREPAIRAWFR